MRHEIGFVLYKRRLSCRILCNSAIFSSSKRPAAFCPTFTSSLAIELYVFLLKVYWEYLEI